MRCFKSLQG